MFRNWNSLYGKKFSSKGKLIRVSGRRVNLSNPAIRRGPTRSRRSQNWPVLLLKNLNQSESSEFSIRSSVIIYLPYKEFWMPNKYLGTLCFFREHAFNTIFKIRNWCSRFSRLSLVKKHLPNKRSSVPTVKFKPPTSWLRFKIGNHPWEAVNILNSAGLCWTFYIWLRLRFRQPLCLL